MLAMALYIIITNKKYKKGKGKIIEHKGHYLSYMKV